jgi:beta-glucanase (GH16 family)
MRVLNSRIHLLDQLSNSNTIPFTYFRYIKCSIHLFHPCSLLTNLFVFTAIWMLPRDWVYGGWPRSGEINIVESKGNDNYMDNGQNVGNTLMGSTLHWGPDAGHNNWWRTLWKK